MNKKIESLNKWINATKKKAMPPKNASKLRIIAVGDSITQGACSSG